MKNIEDYVHEKIGDCNRRLLCNEKRKKRKKRKKEKEEERKRKEEEEVEAGSIFLPSFCRCLFVLCFCSLLFITKKGSFSNSIYSTNKLPFKLKRDLKEKKQ
jgi:hypothetical protein